MIVCLCHRVSDSQIARHVANGCCSFEELQEESRVATGCGACRDCAVDAFEKALTRACASRPAHHEHAALAMAA